MSDRIAPDDWGRVVEAESVAIRPGGAGVAAALVRYGPEGPRRDIAYWDRDQGRWTWWTDDGASTDPAWAPDGSVAWWVRHVGPAESQLIAYTPDRGIRMTIRLPGWARRPAVSPDGRRVACSVLDPPPDPHAPRVIRRLRYQVDGLGFLGDRQWRIWIADAANGRVSSLDGGPFHHFAPAWSPDGRRLAVVTTRRPEWDREWVWDVYVVTVGGDDWAVRTASDGVALHPAWTADGQHLVYLFNHADWTGTTTDYHLAIARASGPREWRCLTHALDRGAADVVEPPLLAPITPAVHPGTGAIWWAANRGGRTCLQATTPDGTSRLVAWDVGWPSIDHRSGWAAAIARTAARPPAPALLAPDGHVVPLGDLNPWLSGLSLAAPRAFTAPSPDGPVSGWYWAQDDAPRQAPALIHYHGGPHLSFGPYFQFAQQLLAGAGFVVIAPNYRGSAGFGQRFADLIHADWGPREAEDGLQATQVLAAGGVVNADRVGVFGASFGGYMTLYLLAFCPDRVRAGVALSSLAHLATSAYGIDHWESGRTDMGGAPWERPDYYRERSPLTAIHRVEAPLLLLHGEEDLTCRLLEAEMAFVGLYWQGKPVELVRYPGESHGFHRQGRLATLVDAHRRLLDWFVRYV